MQVWPSLPSYCLYNYDLLLVVYCYGLYVDHPGHAQLYRYGLYSYGLYSHGLELTALATHTYIGMAYTVTARTVMAYVRMASS